MRTPETETPPAATEGVDYGSAGKHEQGTATTITPQQSNALTPPPGLVGELASYFYSSARYPMKEGAILAALGLVAGVAGRAFNFEGTGLNLYLLLLAESGRGKEDMTDGIEQMLAAAGGDRVNLIDTVPVNEFMGPRKFASGQGLVRVLEHQPVFLSIQNEFGLRLRELNDPRAPASMIDLRQVLLDLYAKSGWGKTFRSTAYSERDKNTKIVQSPCVTILGDSTPGHVFDNLSFRDIEDGLLPRCLILECTEPRSRMNPHARYAPPPELVKQFKTLAVTCLTVRGNNTVQPVVATEDAALALRAMQDELDDAFNDETREPHDRALWNRAGLNIKRIAAIIAVGCMPGATATPVIEEVHVQWAMGFVELCVGGLAHKFREGVVGTGEARQEAEIKRYVREYCALPPAKRRAYKVPQRLAEAEGCIGLDYLRRRARRCTAFAHDRRGFERALSETLAAMCRAGSLFKLQPGEVSNKFGLRGEVYGLADIDVW